MKPYMTLLFIVVLLAGASSAADSLQDAIKRQYKNQVLGLRTSFQKGDQEFDSAGKPLKDADGLLWRSQGAIGVEDVKLDEKILRVKGRQVAYVPTEKKKNKKGPDGQ